MHLEAISMFLKEGMQALEKKRQVYHRIKGHNS